MEVNQDNNVSKEVRDVGEFMGLQGKTREFLPPIKIVEKIDNGAIPLASSFDDILGAEFVNSLFREVVQISPKVPEFYGTTAYINKSAAFLPSFSSGNPEVLEKLRKSRGRNVMIHVLIKTSKGGTFLSNEEVSPYDETVRKDALASRLPAIAPFATWVSEPRRLKSGQLAIAVEQSIDGLDLDDLSLTNEDRRRILYQLLIIGQAYHDAGLSGIDYGKTGIHYLTEKMFEGDAHPRRIKTFDFGYWGTLPADNPSRSKAIFKDLKIMADTLYNFHLWYLPQEEETFVKQFILEMKGGKFTSFKDAATFVDTDGNFKKELEEIYRQTV